MKRFKKILVATDTRHEKHPIVDAAAEIASFNRASLTIVDVVPEFSWLSRHATQDHEHLSELIGKEKQEKLAALVDKVNALGIDVSSKVLSGNTSTEIIKEVIRGEFDLVLAVAKGKMSKREGAFGQTAVRLLRQCPSAVWLVAPDSTPKIKHILGCVDPSSEKAIDTELNEKILELSQSISKYHDARFSILHTWQFEDEAVLGARLTTERVAEIKQDEQRYHEENLEKFLDQYDLSMDSENVHLVKGETAETIGHFADTHAVDLLVMGTVARKGLGGYIIGNKAEKTLDRINCSLLALKPYGFRSSIRV